MVSVIIPVYNNKNTLERAIRSVAIDPLVAEVLIVDDGSKDGSLEIANSMSGLFPKVRVYWHNENVNRGAAASRNLGLSLSKSYWIQFLDADDEVLQNKIEGQLALISNDIPFVVGNSIHVFPDGRRHLRKSEKEVWKGLIRSKLGDTCANLWSRKYLLKVGGWNERLGSSQEYDLMFRLLTYNSEVIFDDRFLTLIYKSENSISTNVKKKNQRVKNWVNLRLRIRNRLILQNNFRYGYRYIWSGSVGLFCKENNTAFPKEIELLMYFIYSCEIWIKVNLYKLILSDKRVF